MGLNFVRYADDCNIYVKSGYVKSGKAANADRRILSFWALGKPGSKRV